MIKKFIKKLRKSRFPYSPLVTITISKKALLHNIQEFQKLNSSVQIAPVLKSNAYGHGLVHVAEILDTHNEITHSIPFLIVDSYFEAITLRAEGIKKPLLIIGYTPSETILSSKLKNIAFGVINIQTLTELSERADSKVSIQLKIDTGMNRQGIQVEELDAAISHIKSNHHLHLQGIFSHFADADSTDPTFTDSQITAWDVCVEKVLSEFPKLQYYHLSNTAGQVHGQKIKANVARLGLGLYGIQQNAPIDEKVHLIPALELKTIVSGVKKIEPGDKIGYNGTFTAQNPMTIATIPVGYFEGLDRRLSNKGFVKIGAHFAPVVGRISMNITVIDISSIPDVRLNDEVTVISSSLTDKNSLEQCAHLCETIPYELLVHLPAHLLRTVY